MILLLLAQLAVFTDSTYSSAALRSLVARAAIENHAPPPAFRGYTAHVESEMSLILRDTLGRERVGQVEQLASAVEWTRGSAYDMHIVGYRTQGLGSPVSSLSFVRGWTEPSLYGERLRLGVDVGGRPATPSASSRDTIVAAHPFASDRDAYYTFSGGDTITVIRSGARSITVVRVRVSPHLSGNTRLGAFDGEIDLDVDRQQIVRMRGRFVVLGRRDPDRPLVAKLAGLVGVAYVEFVNTEVRGKYWLPASQRTELQSTMAVLGHTRAVVRILSTFSDYEVDETGSSPVDDGRRIARRTTWARSDTVDSFGDWRMSVGDATTSVTADDFDDLAPDAWKSTGGVRIDLVPTNIDNVVRFDRVEGLFTGYQATVEMRSVVPGLSFGANGGWAWTEQTIRGGAHVSLRRPEWIFGARAERSLATTNDFIRPFDAQTGGLAAIIGSIDDFDYVDRRLVLLSATHIIGSVGNALVTAQAGVGDDHPETSRLNRGWIGSGTFRPNRGAQSGRYSIAMLDAELHPGISGDFAQPGFGALAHYEVGRGTLEWQRAELSVSALRYWGSVTLLMQGDAGVVTGAVIPPQKLFEMGGSGVLPGYDYKEFVGDRAALFRGFGSYSLPIWKTPHRFRNNLFIPGVSPALAVGIQGGWTDLVSDAGRTSALGLASIPAPHTTNGIRATLGLGMTFFSGAIHAGFARPVDRAAPWKFTIGGGPAF